MRPTKTAREHRIYCAGAGGGADGAAAASLCSPLTRSFNSLLGLKKGIFLAGTSTRSPVLGLRPTRGLRCRVRKLPKPRISILSPARNERTTLSKIVSTMTSLSLRVSSARRETSSIRSAFVIRLRLRDEFAEWLVLPARSGTYITLSNFRYFAQGVDSGSGLSALANLERRETHWFSFAASSPKPKAQESSLRKGI